MTNDIHYVINKKLKVKFNLIMIHLIKNNLCLIVVYIP